MPETSKSRLGKYELLEEIGDGAEGRIFKAVCIEPGVPGVAVGEFVALKRLRQTGNETQSDIFKRTTRILRNLDHPNIVRYKDSFEGNDEALDEPVYCLVTELLEGETLKELMDKNKSGLPWDWARKILLQTLEALEYAGNHSVIHRDLKPSNIYLTHKGDVKIIDFGIAKHEDSGATTTSSGGLLGSWDYMACDFVLMSQESNFRGDQQSDIFSFGVCFYQLLTGVLPYPPLGGNAQIAYFQRYMSPEKLPKVKYNHPVFSVLRGARASVEKCLTFDRAARYKTFTEVLTAIKLLQRRTLQHGDEEQYGYLDYIGKGGFGKVFHARRMRDGLEVAIKEVIADRNASRFVREAKVLKITQHPHLVQYLDFVEVSERGMGEERRLFLVLEFLKGMPQSGLNYRIKMASTGLEPVEVLRMFEGFLDCLEYLHQNTIIHRDIKPGNLYAPANAPEQAKIFDLGIAHDTDGTKTHGQVPGTLDYMPAEFATQGGDRGSAQSDIYSMGVTLYQALTGKLPFERLPDDEKMAWTNWYIRSEKPPALVFDHPVFSAHPELEKLLRCAMAFRAQDRFASAKAMRLEIAAILENWDRAGKKEQYEKALAAARDAFGRQDYTEAGRQVRMAIEVWPEATEAKELLDKIETERLRRVQYDTAIAAAKKELERSASAAAARHVRIALQVWPEGTEAKELLDRIETERQRRIQYDTAIAAAKKELDRDDLDAATRQVQLALEAWPEGVEAKQLLERIEAERQRKIQYDTAIAAARESLAKGELDEAVSKAELALEAWPEKAEARQLLDKIETERLRRIQYDTAIMSARQEVERDEFDAASRHVRLALSVWPEGVEAKQLLERIETERQRRVQYEAAVTAAKKEWERENIEAGIQKAQLALQVWPEKEEAKQLLERLEKEQQRRIKYETAIAAARETMERGDLDDAIRRAQLALEVWPEKVEAKRLLDKIETEKRRKEQYESAIKAAKKALDEGDYETARSQANAALKLRPMDAAGLDLRSLAERGLREMVDDDPKTVATYVEPPPPVEEEAKAPAAILEPPPVAEPKTGSATPTPKPTPSPAAEVETVGTVLDPPFQEPPPETIGKAESAPEPTTPPPEPPPPEPEPVFEPEKPFKPDPLSPAPARATERRKKSKVPVFAAIAAGIVLATGVIFFMVGRKTQAPAPAPVATSAPPVPSNPIPAPAPTPLLGTVTIKSDPVGAEVWLGNTDKGRTPARLDLPAGQTTATLTVSGLKDQIVNLTVAASKASETTVVFAYGSVVIKSEPAGAEVRQNGKVVGHTPYSNPMVAPGQSTWQLAADGWQPANVPVEVYDHKMTPVDIPLRRESGTLRLTGNFPGITASVDGAGAVLLPTDVPVAAAVEHVISAKYKGVAKTMRTLVEKGQTKAVEITFAEEVRTSSRWTNSIGMPFAWVANLPGCAGSQWTPDQGNGGWVAQYDVTQQEFSDVLNFNPSKSKADGNGRYPVENMAFEDAAKFCRELTVRDARSLPQGWHYALPSEGQWEFFAAGTPLDKRHAYYEPPGIKKPTKPEEVGGAGQLAPNSLGLFDILGNVAQLTGSLWHYSSDPDESRRYIWRGGGFDSSIDVMATRASDVSVFEKENWIYNGPSPDVGFRVVLLPP